MKNRHPHTILMTADTVGGVWNYSLILTKALQQYDVHVHLATMGDLLNADQKEEADELENLTIHESNYALEWMENPWQEIDEAGEWLLDLEEKIQPELIHLNNYAFGSLPWNAPSLTVGHSCVLSWWEAVHQEKAPERWHTYQSRIKEGLQHSDVVVSITQSMLDELSKFYGPFSNFRVIYNAQDHYQFRPGKKKPKIFGMGRLWDEAKNMQALQEAATTLTWPVFIAGSGQEKLQSDNNGSAFFLGKLSSEKIAEHLGESSIYVMPARYEPFGLSILEAALSGCALVLGDIPTLRELWNDAALFAAPEDSKKLKNQIEKLIMNPVLRKEMAEKAIKRAGDFSLQKMGAKYWEAYHEASEAFHPQKQNVLTF